MSETIVVAYDGSESAKRAVDFAERQARAQNSSISIVHVLEWSPYTFLTPEEIEERHARRSEELKRAESVIIAPIVEKLAAEGIVAKAVLKYGHIAETLCDVAKSEGAAMVVIGRTGNSSFASRIFGSVAGTLAQAAPVPVTIVP